MTFDTARLFINGGGIGFAAGGIWVFGGWIVNGYPDPLSFLFLVAGGVMVIIGALAIVHLNPPRETEQSDRGDA